MLISGFDTNHVDVDGLLLQDGTLGPVFEVIASLHCSTGGTDEKAFTEVARTGSCPLSPDGDVKFFEFIDLPEQCAAAIVLIGVDLLPKRVERVVRRLIALRLSALAAGERHLLGLAAELCDPRGQAAMQTFGRSRSLL